MGDFLKALGFFEPLKPGVNVVEVVLWAERKEDFGPVKGVGRKEGRAKCFEVGHGSVSGGMVPGAGGVANATNCAMRGRCFAAGRSPHAPRRRGSLQWL